MLIKTIFVADASSSSKELPLPTPTPTPQEAADRAGNISSTFAGARHR
jgi:hypothetical protein